MTTLAAFTATEWVIVLTAATGFVGATVAAIATAAVKIINALQSHGEDLKLNTAAVAENTAALQPPVASFTYTTTNGVEAAGPSPKPAATRGQAQCVRPE